MPRAAVRQFGFVEGHSAREAGRVLGLAQKTISKMCLYAAPPGYQRQKSTERPMLGPFIGVTDAILDSNKQAPPRQWHTAKRIFERLKAEHGYGGGLTVVKVDVRRAEESRLARGSCRQHIRQGPPRWTSARRLV